MSSGNQETKETKERVDEMIIDLGTSKKIVVGLSWDVLGKENPVDLDASCVVFNSFGQIVDSVFYNNLKIDNVVHSGDNLVGGGENEFNETIEITFKGLDPKVACFVIVLNCFKGGSFAEVESAHASILNDEEKEVSQIKFPCNGANSCLIYCIIYKEFGKETSWKIKPVGRKATGRHFKDAEKEMKEELEFIIPKEIQKEVAYDPNFSKKKFDLYKGQVLRLTGLRKIFFALGWSAKCDLDASIICFGSEGQCFKNDIVCFNNLSNKNESIVHRGDKKEGKIVPRKSGLGKKKTAKSLVVDDEMILLDLPKIPSEVHSIFCVVTIYDEGVYFNSVKGAYCRLVDESTKKEVCRFNLTNQGGKREAIIMACVFKDFRGDWRMKAIGEGADGRKAEAYTIIRAAATRLPTFSLFSKVATIVEKLRNLSDVPMIEIKKKVLKFKAKASNCEKLDLFGLSDPYFILYQTKNKKFEKVYKSEVVKNTLDPKWKDFTIDSINVNNPLKVIVFDWNKITKDDYMGEFSFKLKEVPGMQSGFGVGKFDIINPKKKKKKGYLSSGVLEIEITPGMEVSKSMKDPKHQEIKNQNDKEKEILFKKFSVV